MKAFPFFLKVPLVTPVIISKYPVHFDGLLAFVLGCHHETDQIEDLMDDYLVATDGIRHGSTLLFVPEESEIVTFKKVGFVRRLAGERDLNTDAFKPNGKGGRYRRVVTEGGPFKSRLRLLPGFYCQTVGFYGNGYPERILELLRYYAPGIGRTAASGGGQCLWDEASYERLDRDYSLVDRDGLPNRIIPLDRVYSLTGLHAYQFLGREISVGQFAVKTPYFGRTVEAVAPAPIRIAKIHA